MDWKGHFRGLSHVSYLWGGNLWGGNLWGGRQIPKNGYPTNNVKHPVSPLMYTKTKQQLHPLLQLLASASSPVSISIETTRGLTYSGSLRSIEEKTNNIVLEGGVKVSSPSPSPSPSSSSSSSSANPASRLETVLVRGSTIRYIFFPPHFTAKRLEKEIELGLKRIEVQQKRGKRNTLRKPSASQSSSQKIE